MRGLGIALLIFNLLLTAVIGLYLAPTASSKRQEMTASVARHYLAREGLPLTAAKFNSGDSTQPISIRMTAGQTFENVPNDFLKGHFAGVESEGGLVNSQTEEFERAYSDKLAKLGDSALNALNEMAGSFNAQGQYTSGFLTAMAGSYAERSEIRALAVRPNAPANVVSANLAKAKEIFKKKYDDAAAAKSEAEKKAAIAHFLAHLNPSSNTWQKRVILVVGMKQYTQTIADQAASYDEIARRIARKIEQDQSHFVTEYETLKKLAIERAQLRNRQKEVENGLAQIKADDEKAVKTSERQKGQRDEELAKLRATVKDQLDRNAALEKTLQETQRQVGEMLDRILAEEVKLEKAETASTGR